MNFLFLGDLRLELFWQPFLVAFALTIVCILLFLFLPVFQRSVWRKGKRHIKRVNVSRLGGVAMLLSFVVTFFLDPHLVITKEWLGLIAGLGIVFIFGLWDDFREMDWKLQLFFQVVLAIVVFLFGMRIFQLTNPFGGVWNFPTEGFIIPAFLILLVWLFLVMNSMNWLDGVDGVCGSVGFMTLLTIFLLSLSPTVNQPPVAIVAVIGMGVTAGFLLFNVAPAHILAGTVGSLFLGFLIAILAIIAGTKIATALMVLSLPIADALWVIAERLRAGRSIFQADQRHLHYKLRELGWSERQIAGVFFGVTALIAFVALNTEALGKFLAILLVLGIIFIFLFTVDRKIQTKTQTARS